MNLNIKEHLRFELSIIYILLIISIVTNGLGFNIYFQFLIFITLLGVFNVGYFTCKISEYAKEFLVIIIVLFVFTSGLQIVFSIFFSIPIIIFEIIYIVGGNKYIGKNSKKINEEYKQRKSLKNLSKEEKTCIKLLCSRYQIVMVIKIILLIIFMIIVKCISNNSNNMLTTSTILLALAALISLGYMILKLFIINKVNNKRIVPILADKCDSRACYHIYQHIYNKYNLSLSIISDYIIILRLDDNDYSELKQVLNTNLSYRKFTFYLNAIYDVSDEVDKLEKFQPFYKKELLFNEKKYRQTKEEYWNVRNTYLKAEYSYLLNEFDKALEIYQTISNDTNKFCMIKKKFVEGKCLMELGREKEAMERFNYVIDNGNTLRVCKEAKNLKVQLESNIK